MNIDYHSMEICRNADNFSNAALQIKVSKCMYDLFEAQTGLAKLDIIRVVTVPFILNMY